MASAIAAPTWFGAIRPAATAAAIAPSARRPLRPISANRHAILETIERLLPDELPRSEVLDRDERLPVA